MLRKIYKLFKVIWNSPTSIERKILARRVERAKQKKIISKVTYNENPKISFVVQFFNKRHNVRLLIERLRLIPDSEIIVIDDGSLDGSYDLWPSYLDRLNDFLMRCNDIFEVRTYNRAISMSRDEFVCLLQDDDIPPADIGWVNQAIALFSDFSDLIMLGGRDGLDLLIPDHPSSSEEPKYEIHDDVAGYPGINKYKIYRKPEYLHPNLNIPFMFSMVVNRAPTFLRRKEFVELGGINQEFAPFQCDDVEASLRIWQKGGKVALYDVPFQRDVGIGGMRLFSSTDRISSQARKNWLKVYEIYGSRIQGGYFRKLVSQSNSNLLVKS